MTEAKKKRNYLNFGERELRAQLAMSMVKHGAKNLDIKRETLQEFGVAINAADVAAMRAGRYHGVGAQAAPAKAQAEHVMTEADDIKRLANKLLKAMRARDLSFMSVEARTGEVRVERMTKHGWRIGANNE